MRVQSAPSRYLYMDDLLPMIARSCLAATSSMVKKEPCAELDWSPNPGTMNRVQHGIAVRTATRTVLTVRDADETIPCEDVTTAFHRLFGINYIHGEFYTQIEMRPSEYEAIPDRSASEAASVLITEAHDQ